MWHDIKLVIKTTSGLNDAALHVLFGAASYIILVIVLRRPVLALLATALIQVANEVVDLIENATGTGVAGSIVDILWTLILPVLFFLVARVRDARRAPLSIDGDGDRSAAGALADPENAPFPRGRGS